MAGLIIFLIVMPVIAVLIWRFKKPVIGNTILPINYRKILNEYVLFYKNLDDEKKLKFEERVKDFLSYTRIHGINTEVTDMDKLFVAASAIIPVFAFNWRYYNLTDVLLYDGTFNENDFSVAKQNSNITGMVGTGAMQRMMILSKPALREGFENEISKSNTGIHEFVHLLDKADGDIDGIPEALLSKQYTLPWIQHMNEEMQRMKSGTSDINIYGATNKAEFFAVASEYFFGSPERFQKNHPELFNLMAKIFHQEQAIGASKNASM